MTKISRTILPDTPSQTDAFSGGGHDRVSLSLAKTIEDLDGRDAAIGLDGNWGSGKSSIIKMAADKLPLGDKKKTYHVLTFDLWANQSLSFRRAFLEKFIDWAMGQRELADTKAKRKELENYRKRIGGREEDVEQTNQVHFNLIGAIFVLALPLFPLVYTWLSPFAIKPTAVPNCRPDCHPVTEFQHWFTVHAPEVAFVLLVALYGAVIVNVFKLAWQSGLRQALKKTAGLIEQKTEGTLEKKLIRDVDPTNAEFSKTFRDILGLLQTKTRRIIVVFDNIDRLHQDKVAVAWSDVQAVLQRDQESQPERVLTAVVPYDRNVIEAAQYISDGEAEDKSKTGAKSKQDIFRKSFDVIHHVAPPVISDVAAFFQDRLKFGLNGNIDDAEAERVARIFDLTTDGAPCTPRQVAAFVNEITTLWVEWDGQIPLDAIAVFVANRNELEAQRTASEFVDISQSKFGSRTACSVKELEEFLAMLAFSAPKELAMEIALYAPIRAEIVKQSSSQLGGELANSSAFPLMLCRVIDENIEDFATNSLEFDRVVGNLAELDNQAGFVQVAISSAVSQLPKLQPSDPEDLNIYESILALPAVVQPAEATPTTKAIIDWLQSSLPTKSGDRTADHGRYWLEAIAQLRDAWKREQEAEWPWADLQAEITLPHGSEFLYGAAVAADAQELALRGFKTPVRLAGEILALANRLEKPDENLASAFEQIMALPKAAAPKALFESLIQKLNTSPSSSFESLDALRSLIKIYTIFTAKDAHQNSASHTVSLIENGAIFAHIEEIISQENLGEWPPEIAEIVVLLIAELDFKQPNQATLQNHPQLGNISAAGKWFVANLLESEPDADLLDQLVHAAQKQCVDYKFVLFAADANQRRAIHTALGQRLLSTEPKMRLHPSDFLPAFESLHQLDGVGALRYGAIIDTADHEWAGVKPLEISHHTLGVISTAQVQHWPNLLAKLDSALASRTTAEWTKDLSTNAVVLGLAGNRIEHGGFKPTVVTIKPALLNHLVSVASESAAPARELEQFLGALPTNSAKSLRKEFLEHLATKPVDGTGVANLLDTCPKFMNELPFVDLADISFSKILRPMLTDLNDQFASFIEQNKRAFKAVVAQAGDDARTEIQEILQPLPEPENQSFQIDNVAANLGVTLDREVKKQDRTDDKEADNK